MNGASRCWSWLTTLVLVLGCAVSGPARAQASPAPYLTGFRYQSGGSLLTGVIKPAPSGASNFLATRYTYDANGRLERVEIGVLASWEPDSVAPAQWGGFTVGKTITYGYDANGNKVAETVTGSDGAITNETQQSYDAYDRLTCVAVRMNLGSLPQSACDLGAQGAYGFDRITEYSYDSLNRVTQVTKAAGTPAPVA